MLPNPAEKVQMDESVPVGKVRFSEDGTIARCHPDDFPRVLRMLDEGILVRAADMLNSGVVVIENAQLEKVVDDE